MLKLRLLHYDIFKRIAWNDTGTEAKTRRNSKKKYLITVHITGYILKNSEAIINGVRESFDSQY